MTKLLKTAAILLTTTGAVSAADLAVMPFNPGANSIFAVTSTVIEGPTEVLLVDAQFEKDEAQELLKRVQATGKPLTTIYISAGDPDFYFGLDVIKAAYPDARVVATAETVAHITESFEGKVGFWGPILGENAPEKVIIPEVLEGSELSIDGTPIQIMGPDAHRTFLWVPSEATVLGGVTLVENMHVWMADTQTPQSRELWLASLDAILALDPARVIAGHTIGASTETTEIVTFTRDYVNAFTAEAEKAANSDALIAAMSALYPDFAANDTLAISAKVLKGEMKWPQ